MNISDILKSAAPETIEALKASDPELFGQPIRRRINKPIVNGIKFDSQTESDRYSELNLMERSGDIRHLSVQPRFLLQEGSDEERPMHYTADFMYHEDVPGGGGMRVVVEEVKSEWTVKAKDYIMRRKMFKSRYPHYEFREVIR